MFISGIPLKKLTLTRFFERVYKIKAVIVFSALVTLVLKYLSFYLTWDQFLSKEHLFNKNNPYLKNISQLMSLLLRIKSIFSIIAALNKIEYELENKAVLMVQEKLVIAVTKLQVCYLIV